jgi:CubicO group peptidase (beta-lactamase class C family)
MRRALPLAVLASLAFLAGLSAQTPVQRLPRSTPEAQGVSSAALIEFVKAADTKIDSFNSFMLVRHGHVVAEGWWAPYSAEDPHWLYSLTKSFTSTAEGLAIAEGKLSLDDQVIKFFPEEAPDNPSANLKQMRVRDLLRMSTGHDVKTVADFQYHTADSPIRRFLGLPVDHHPGSIFVYDSPGTLVQSAIVQKVTGQTTHDYLRTRLFEPLGFGDPDWGMTEQGVSIGPSELSIRTEDIACFGQLLLQKGNWNGRQLVPAGWIEEATAKQVTNGSDPTSDWDQGYGYQFWRCKPGFYRADGAFGQFCFVMPQYDAVLAVTSGTKATQAEMDIVYDNVLPAFHDGVLPANDETDAALSHAIASLTIHSPPTGASSPMADQVSGKTYFFPANNRKLESVTLLMENGETKIKITGDGYDGAPIVVGHDGWKRGGLTAFGTDVDPREPIFSRQPVAAIGGWTSSDTLTAKLCYYDTPYSLTLQLQFGGELVVLTGDYNISFHPNALPVLIGHTRDKALVPAPGT